MKILKTLGVTWLGFSLIAGLFTYKALAFDIAEQVDQPYAYQIVSQSPGLKLAPNTPGWLKVTIRNIGQENWQTNQLRLGAVYFNGAGNRVSQFATSEWENGQLLKPTTEQAIVEPLDKIVFNVPMQATNETAKFQEDFRVIVNGNLATGDNIHWLIQVGDEITTQSVDEPTKRIQVSLDKQRLWAIENHVVVMDIPVSTGKPGYGTPTGTYTIANHAPRAYSAEYKLYMNNWMALAGPDSKKLGGYGVHMLPSWKVNPAKYAGLDGQYIGSRYYEDGWIYEDATHLGKKMSHGCVRVGVKEAPILYDWADNGTVVNVS